MDNYFEEFFNEIIEWNKVGMDEDEWGTPEFKELYWKIFESEYQELKKGFRENDMIEVMDGLGDCYFVAVMLVYLNSDLLTKDTQFAEGIITVSKLIALLEPIVRDRRDESVFYLMSALCKAMDRSNYPMKHVVREIIRSNWTKYPTVEEVNSFYGDGEYSQSAINKACKWIENNRGYANVRAREKNGRLIFRADGGNGKVMKWENFSQANLKQYLTMIEGDY